MFLYVLGFQNTIKFKVWLSIESYPNHFPSNSPSKSFRNLLDVPVHARDVPIHQWKYLSGQFCLSFNRYIHYVLQCTDTCKACTDTLVGKIRPKVSISSSIDSGIKIQYHVPIHGYHVPIHVWQNVLKMLKKDEHARINEPNAFQS